MNIEKNYKEYFRVVVGTREKKENWAHTKLENL